MAEPRAALRAAIRRLRSAIGRDAVEVTVQRRDLEVLMACVYEARQLRPVDLLGMPALHPEQR